MNKVKVYFLAFLCMTFVFSTQAFAADNNGVNSVSEVIINEAVSPEVIEFIFSDEATAIIKSHIDFNRDGTQSVYLGNDITFTYISGKMATRSVVSDTMTSIFTKGSGSNTQTVATLRLACSFTYNGTTVSIKSDDYKATAEAIPNWSCTANASHKTDSKGDVYVSATYTLYYNGDYNANGYMDMSCDKNGKITKHYPWS